MDLIKKDLWYTVRIKKNPPRVFTSHQSVLGIETYLVIIKITLIVFRLMISLRLRHFVIIPWGLYMIGIVLINADV